MFTPEPGIETPIPRIREITFWKLMDVPLSKGHTPKEKYISGLVVKDAGVTLNFVRITTTSPIQYRKGRILITESGSQYTLLEPAQGQDPEAYKTIPEAQVSCD